MESIIVEKSEMTDEELCKILKFRNEKLTDILYELDKLGEKELADSVLTQMAKYSIIIKSASIFNPQEGVIPLR